MTFDPNQARDASGRWTASGLNAHLASGVGVVQVTTQGGKSWLYNKKHAGMFFEGSKTGDLRVKQGKSSVALSQGNQLLVGIRLGYYKK